MLSSAFSNGWKNIAISGPYCSGKSSIIKTYIENQNNSELVKKEFLKLSLTAFLIEKTNRIGPNGKETNDDKNKKTESDLKKSENKLKIKENDIEKSLLQQLFYKAESKEIPFSRFNKLTHIRFLEIFFKITFVTIILFFIVFFIKPEIITLISNQLEQINTMLGGGKIAAYLLLIIYILVIILFTFLTRFLIARIHISKFGISKAEIELKENENSVFNKYLDEIIYFFEATRYEVVIFEDLDRFNTTDIFVKLRELNFLLNNSNKIKKEIFFIYAIGDAVFTNEKRTKFFDFIIPVIPIINNTNSGELLITEIKKIGLQNEFSKEFIYKIAAHFSDMRILKSSINEYKLYKHKIRLKLNHEKLFSLMLYKNFNPEDFDNLQKNSGILFNAFYEKNLKLKNKLDHIQKEISLLEEKIKHIEKEHIESVEELKGAFFYTVCSQGLNTIRIIKVDKSVKNFEFSNSSSFNFNLLSSFSNIQILNRTNNAVVNEFTMIDFNSTYSQNSLTFYERYLNINENKDKQLENLQIKIQDFLSQKNNINEISLELYINEYGLEEFPELKGNAFLAFLLREGYVKEDYINYISNFYPGRLTQGDMNFILNVYHRSSPEYLYALTRPEMVIEKLEKKYFKINSIYCVDIVKTLLFLKREKKSKTANSKLFILLTQIDTLDTESLKFIEFIFLGKYQIPDFIRLFCVKSNRFWGYIRYVSEYPKNHLDQYLIQLFKYADIDSIFNMDNHSEEDLGIKKYSLSTYMNDHPSIISLLIAEIQEEKFFSIISGLENKFSKIQGSDINNNIFDFIVENNYYEINKHMLELIISKKIPNEDKIILSYSLIQETEYIPFIDYIDENIEDFLENVYFSFRESIEENEPSIRKLLRLTNLENSFKEKVIEKAIFLLSDFESIDSSLCSILLNHDRVMFSINNILKYHIEHGIDAHLCQFLIKNLTSENQQIMITKERKDQYKKFFDDLLQSQSFKNIPVFEKLITEDIRYENFQFPEINSEKVLVLINHKKIIFNKNNFDFIREYYIKKLINFCENDFQSFLNQYDELNFPSELIDQILLSDKIENKDKFKFIEILNNSNFSPENPQVCEKIILAIVSDKNSIFLEKNLYEILVSSNITKDIKVELLLNQIDYLENSEIIFGLEKIGGDYSDITIKRRRPKIKNTKNNLTLAKKLEELRLISSFETNKNFIRINTFHN